MHLPDFHSHILPGVDHGSDSLDCSLKQLRLAASYGIDRIVSTSHFYPHELDIDDFLTSRNAAYAALCESGKEALGEKMPQIFLGAEVLLCPGVEKLKRIEKLCIGEKNVLLLELPFARLSETGADSIHSLIKKGFRVILAHADRYAREDIDFCLTLGVKLQLNADALSMVFPRRYLMDWISDGHVVALGSDIHGVDRRAYKNFIKAEKRLFAMYDEIRERSIELLG